MSKQKQLLQSQLGWKFLDPLGNIDKAYQKTVYVPYKFGHQHNGQEEGAQINFRIKQQKEQHRMQIYLSTESDLFFLYRAEITNKALEELTAKYQINCKTLKQFINFISKYLDLASNSKDTFLQMVIIDQRTLRIDFFKQLNSKRFIVVQFFAQKQTDVNSKMLAAFKYGKLRQQINQKQKLILRTKQIIKKKNPYLLTFLNKF